MSVYLLSRKGRRGKSSLLLIHYNKGKRNHQFLKLYTYDHPKDATEREHNREVMRLAKQIKAQKELDAQFSQHHTVSPVKEKIGLLQFFQKAMKQKGNSSGLSSAYLHLKNYLKDSDIKLSHIDNIWLSNYQSHLLTAPIGRGNKPLARNSALCYYTKLAVIIKQAYMERYIKINPCETLKTIKPAETHRNYVTLEEIAQLKQTECSNDELKRAFLFCCYTGLRFSDVQALQWEQFSFSEATGWQLTYTQQKTKAAEVLPIAPEAMELLTNLRASVGKVFLHLKNSSWHNQTLKVWFLKAGITKPLTFHSSRHSFATNLLAMNVNLSVISKLLGHKRIRTTEIYSKVVNLSLVEAVNKFSNSLN